MEMDSYDSDSGFETDPEEVGGVFDIYYRNSDPNGPREDLLQDAQLAIASYNKTNREQESQCYTVVDIIRSEKYLVAGHMLFIDFTAKLPNQDAITFRTEIWKRAGVVDPEVSSVRPITAEEAASDQIRNTVWWP